CAVFLCTEQTSAPVLTFPPNGKKVHMCRLPSQTHIAEYITPVRVFRQPRCSALSYVGDLPCQSNVPCFCRAVPVSSTRPMAKQLYCCTPHTGLQVFLPIERAPHPTWMFLTTTPAAALCCYHRRSHKT
ncbi:unnamed protein product, partial [Ectocarpus sp. 12 AP-2014]